MQDNKPHFKVFVFLNVVVSVGAELSDFPHIPLAMVSTARCCLASTKVRSLQHCIVILNTQKIKNEIGSHYFCHSTVKLF